MRAGPLSGLATIRSAMLCASVGAFGRQALDEVSVVRLERSEIHARDDLTNHVTVRLYRRPAGRQRCALDGCSKNLPRRRTSILDVATNAGLAALACAGSLQVMSNTPTRFSKKRARMAAAAEGRSCRMRRSI